MKYVVSINYYKFKFDESVSAMEFAELALMHTTDDSVAVSIELDGEKEVE